MFLDFLGEESVKDTTGSALLHLWTAVDSQINVTTDWLSDKNSWTIIPVVGWSVLKLALSIICFVPGRNSIRGFKGTFHRKGYLGPLQYLDIWVVCLLTQHLRAPRANDPEKEVNKPQNSQCHFSHTLFFKEAIILPRMKRAEASKECHNCSLLNWLHYLLWHLALLKTVPYS